VSSAQQGDVVHFSRVTLAVNGITITADEAVFNKATQEVEFRGSVRAKLPPRQ
jgi:lipopolysaccharide assembly outer membrane protein LptD (OstA)